MAAVAVAVAVAVARLAVLAAEGPNLFADLPLCGFEEPARSRRAEQPGFHLSPPGTDWCLASRGVNVALSPVECEAEDGQLWVYVQQTRQLRLASDISLCLDVFGPHAGSQLGTYFCHDGINQQFLRSSNAEFDGYRYCALNDRFCVRRQDPSFVTRKSGFTPSDQDAPECKADSSTVGPSCVRWAAVGECTLSPDYMQQHCQTSCARKGYGSCHLGTPTPPT
ncbi:hypothetical protein AB1Y20_006641 [Prymnesium parvum]|uniref:ShKT domain-containing protein n=1 Tax=Prymnesium parvum TaxID=97485 RepID=A0AB34J163_PRYPA